MVAIMLMTDTFRGNIAVSRWRDAVWLGWLVVPLYWLHQLEEYSLPVLGFDIPLIQEGVCKLQGYPAYPDCPIPMPFYPLVNIALMWVGAPLAAYLGRRNVAIGLSFWGFTIANGSLHLVAGIVSGAYNPGMWSAVLFVSLSLWVIYACGIRGPYSAKVLSTAFVAGFLGHVMLGLSYLLLKVGVYGGSGMLAFSILVGFSPIIFAAIGSRFMNPGSLKPVPAT
jgi:Protein of unknown function with HXXEE motif